MASAEKRLQFVTDQTKMCNKILTLPATDSVRPIYGELQLPWFSALLCFKVTLCALSIDI